MDQEFRPIDQFLIDGTKGFLVVRGEPDSLPPLCGEVTAFGGLEVEVQSAAGGVWTDCRIAGVGEGASLAAAKAGYVVFVAAEGLGFRIESGGKVSRWFWDGPCRCRWEVERMYLSLKEQNCWFITCHTISSDAAIMSL